jgi:hypothetical protein
MGLMYIFPTSDEDLSDDRITITNKNELILKTYGLPMIFWGYLLATIAVMIIMWLASRAVVLKLLSYTDDSSLIFLGHLVQWTLIFLPIILLGFFFYEKLLLKKERRLKIVYKVFFIPFWNKIYTLKNKESLSVSHFMDSPNMAKIRRHQGLPESISMKGFENKGYFEINILTEDERSINIDRHSRKADLIKLKELLSKY